MPEKMQRRKSLISLTDANTANHSASICFVTHGQSFRSVQARWRLRECAHIAHRRVFLCVWCLLRAGLEKGGLDGKSSGFVVGRGGFAGAAERFLKVISSFSSLSSSSLSSMFCRAMPQADFGFGI